MSRQRACKYGCVYIHIYMCIYMCTHVTLCIYVYIYICVHVYMCMCVSTAATQAIWQQMTAEEKRQVQILKSQLRSEFYTETLLGH